MDFSNISSIGEIDGVGELNSDTTITRCFGRYGERGISHGVEHGNDFTDRVVSRRDRSLLVIGVGDHIGRIHVFEYDGLDLNRTVMEVMVGFRYLYGLILSNVPLVSKPWISME